MSTKRRFLAFAALLILAQPSMTWAARAIHNVEGSTLPANLSDKQIQAAMVSGGQTRGWIVKGVAPGHMEATLFVRSHMAKVDITYTKNSYSIRYKDSQNLGYADGKIHRNYNKWVQNLDMDIQRALALQ